MYGKTKYVSGESVKRDMPGLKCDEIFRSDDVPLYVDDCHGFHDMTRRWDSRVHRSTNMMINVGFVQRTW